MPRITRTAEASVSGVADYPKQPRQVTGLATGAPQPLHFMEPPVISNSHTDRLDRCQETEINDQFKLRPQYGTDTVVKHPLSDCLFCV